MGRGIGLDDLQGPSKPQAFCCVDLAGFTVVPMGYTVLYFMVSGVSSLSLGLAYETVEVTMIDKKIGSLLD